MINLLKRFAVAYILVAIWALLTGASAQTEQTAFGIAGVAAIILPFILKIVPAAGHYMIAICMISSLIIAAASMLLSGEAKFDDLQHTDVPTLLVLFLTVEALSQRLYSILIQSPKTEAAVV